MDVLLGFSQCWIPGPGCRVNWEAWAAVFTAAVGYLAWKTARRAVAIAAQQHAEAVSDREANARIIGRLLLVEITALPAHVHSIQRAWESAIAWGIPNRIQNGAALRFALVESGQSVLPAAESIEGRIHHLPDALGDDLATLIGGSRAMNNISRRIADRVREPGDHPLRSLAPLYAGSPSDFDPLRGQLQWLVVMSIQFANEFRAYVGVEPQDYSSITNGMPPDLK